MRDEIFMIAAWVIPAVIGCGIGLLYRPLAEAYRVGIAFDTMIRNFTPAPINHVHPWGIVPLGAKWFEDVPRFKPWQLRPILTPRIER